MSCTYAFNITGWSHVYIKDDEYAKNRLKYSTQSNKNKAKPCGYAILKELICHPLNDESVSFKIFSARPLYAEYSNLRNTVGQC